MLKAVEYECWVNIVKKSWLYWQIRGENEKVSEGADWL